MKTIFKTTILLLAVLTIFSCNKDEEVTEPVGYYMTAKIDQEDFEAKPETVKVTYYTDNGDFMVITSETANNRRISMTVNLQNYTQGSGTYTEQEVDFHFSVFDPVTSFETDHWATNVSGAGGGTLTITEEDTAHLKGTFNFSPFHSFGDLSVYNTSLLITNGKFNAKK